ncbi:MAG: hypothetical protein QNJ67_05675 [Kiloniellales bacterium]|nr:hypothetical protein [Kiloniellales bacterium]
MTARAWLDPARFALAALLLAAVLLGACGKKGNVRPPEDEAGAYTFPRAYPAPASVLPAGDEEKLQPSPEPRLKRERRERRLSPFPRSPERVENFGI